MAAKEPDPQPQRKWVPATVGVCHWQTATDRFGPEAKTVIRDRERTMNDFLLLGPEFPPENLNGNSVDERSIHSIIPTTQPFRNNLTALSQAYNLYFVAYQSYIFVYVPRCIVRQRLPKHPDCRLRCEPSSVARRARGHTNPRVPHAVNNLVTGFLGSKEIVVACCDDGDVYAYYTKDIAEWISSQDNSLLAHQAGPTRSKTASTKPLNHFFRESVGESAWGLAVHQQSRLIAVSSNRREITVFAFALNTLQNSSNLRKDINPSFDEPATFVRSRTRNFRIILALGYRADNLPSICFIDDNKGEADKVSAVDIDGTAWISNIWTAKQPVVYIGPLDRSLRRSEESFGEPSRGWGILALPSDRFLTVDTVEELIGGTPGTILPVGRACSQPMADVEPCVRAIPENPCPQIHSDPAQNHDQNHDPFMAIIGAPATIGATFWDLQAITTLVETVNGPVEMPIETPNLGVGTASAELEDVVDESDVLGNEPFNMEVGAEDEEDAEDDNGEEAFAEPFVEPWEYDLAEDFLVGPVDDQETTTDDANSSSPGSPFLPPGGVWTAVALATGAGSNELDTPGVGSEVPEQQANNGTGNQALMTGSQDSPSWGSQQAPSWAFYNSAYNSAYRDVGASNLNWHETGRQLVYYPHSGQIRLVPEDTSILADFLMSRRPVNDSICSSLGTLGSTSRGYHLVRAYEKDLEMRALEDMDVGGQREIGIYCPNTLTFGYRNGIFWRKPFRATSRMSLVLHVPELSLVIIGSPTGRVLLVTPTRLPSRQSAEPGYWRHGMRVEWVLPRTSDDIRHGHDRRPLHGIAVGPVQDERGVGGRGSQRDSTPHRYRLMLHFRNHDIASFEITRQEQTGKLCVF